MKYTFKFNSTILIVFTLSFSSCRIARNLMPSSSYTSIEIKNDSIYYTPIIWSYDSLSDGDVKKRAMYIPVYIKDFEKNALMQFDLGANVSGFYFKTLNLLIEEFPEIQNHIKTTEKGRVYYENAKISINEGVTLHKDNFYVWRNMGHDTLPKSIPIIGTIGYDILDDYILIVDYKNERIALVKKLPLELEKKVIFIENADLKKFPVILPFKLGKKKIRLLFDTGSSSAQVLTSTKRLKKLAVGREIIPIDSGYSWGKLNVEYKAKSSKFKEPILYIDNINLGKVEVTGVESLNKMFTISGNFLYGITGNIMFGNRIIVIDRKNNRFGITENL